MNSANHVVFSVGFTAISCSFLDVNIYEPTSLGLVVGAGLIADIDHPSSLVGRLIPPISKKINRQFGHRTITHSVFALGASTAIAHIFGFGAVWFFAFLSHIIGDMITRSGVAFLYPFSSNRWVIPGERRWRLKSGDNKAELAVFVLSAALCISTIDLAQVGIKSSFHRTFKTFSHAKSEAERKPVFIESEKSRGEVVRVGANELLLFDGVNFRHLEETETIKEIKEGGKFQVVELELLKISADSLRSYRNILAGEIQCNYPFSWKDGPLEKSGKLAKFEALEYFDFEEPVLQDNSEELAKLEAKLSVYEEIYFEENQIFLEKKKRLQYLNSNYESLSSYEQGKAIAEIKELSEIQKPKQHEKVRELKTQIRLLELEQPEPIYFSGTLKIIKDGKGNTIERASF